MMAGNNYNTNTAASFERVVQALLLQIARSLFFLRGKRLATKRKKAVASPVVPVPGSISDQ